MMQMPERYCGQYKYVIHARDSLTTWPEMRAVTSQDAKVCATFLLEDIICRWGTCKTIVTDNAKLWTNAVKYLTKKYGIRGISISAYNSQANGKIERCHLDTREVIIKACGYENLKHWRLFLPHAAWSERITIRKRYGCSPYFMVTGTHPLIPLDIVEATYLIKPPDGIQTPEQEIADRAVALMKNNKKIEQNIS